MRPAVFSSSVISLWMFLAFLRSAGSRFNSTSNSSNAVPSVWVSLVATSGSSLSRALVARHAHRRTKCRPRPRTVPVIWALCAVLAHLGFALEEIQRAGHHAGRTGPLLDRGLGGAAAGPAPVAERFPAAPARGLPCREVDVAHGTGALVLGIEILGLTDGEVLPRGGVGENGEGVALAVGDRVGEEKLTIAAGPEAGASLPAGRADPRRLGENAVGALVGSTADAVGGHRGGEAGD